MKASRWVLSLAVAALAVPALGQQQVNNQVNTQAQPMGGQQLDNRVRGELYGNNYASGSVHYQQQILFLPSEELFAIQRSGALPSEIRMNSEAVGPLAPQGVASYLPGESALQKAVGARPPVLFGPAYGPQVQTQNGAPGPTPGVSPYQQDMPTPPRQQQQPETPPPAQYVQPQRIYSGVPIDRRVQPGLPAPEPAETIHYYRLPRRATTQPTTQPSLADEPAKAQ